MSLLKNLFEGDFVDYVANTQAQFPRHESTWMLIHIPKTAGSSFREEMADVLQPDVNVEADYNALANENSSANFQDMIQAALNGLEESMNRTHIAFASGHVKYSDTQRHLGNRKMAYTTVLRDPIKRLVSDYVHRTSPQHPLFEIEKAKFPTFRHYIEEESTHNQMAEYLRGDSKTQAGDLSSILDSLYKNFSFVGAQEAYTISLKVQMALLGCRARMTHQIRRSGVNNAQLKEIAAPADINAAQELNSLDISIYEHFRAKWARIDEGIHYYIDHDRIFKMLAGLSFR